MKILILGLGSIGTRHIKVITELDSSAKFFALRSSKSSTKVHKVHDLYNWDEVKVHSYYFSIISSPSALHFDHIKKLSKFNIPIFIEKPLCTSRTQLDRLKKIKIKSLLYVAFNMRFHPLIIFLKKYLLESKNKINEVNIYYGSFLPDWRLKNHKKVYSSLKELGGGVHLDLLHEPDYLFYLFGLPRKVIKNIRRVSSVTVDSYDYANLIFEYEDFSAQITLNYFRRDKKRFMEIITEKNSLEVDFIKGTIIDLKNNQLIRKLDGDLMAISYKKQMEYWFTSIEQNKVKINNLSESKMLLETVL